MGKQYDVAAYIWPSYTGDEPRTRQFWPEGIGEWQTVKNTGPKFPGHSWPRKPLWGYVNEADPYVMEMEIAAAADHGVNVFIYDWYWYDRRPFLENCLNDGFLKAGNRDRMQFYLMWANHDATYGWDIRNSQLDNVVWLGATDRKEFEIVCHRVIDRYFSQPNYYKIDGAPVFEIYDLNNLMLGLGGIEGVREGLAWFREQTRRAGFPDLHLQLTVWSENAVHLSGVDGGPKRTSRDVVADAGFDSVTHYQYVHYLDVDRDYADLLPDVLREWDRLDKEYPVPYFPHVSVGWDANPRWKEVKPGIIRNNPPSEFEKALRHAKAYVDAHPDQAPLITLNSWNEWTEVSYLEPDDLYGYGYLEAVRRVFLDE